MLIGEVSQRAGISARMLRHYDSTGLVSPTGRTSAGYRAYSDADLQRLFHVEVLRSLGLSLREVRRALDDPAFAPADVVDELIARTRQRIAHEEDLLRRLRQVQASGPAQWDDALRIVALLRGLHSDDPSRRQTSALATAESDATRLAGTLAEAVLAEDVPNVAGALRWALARSGDEALSVLTSALDSPDEQVRERAVRMIAELSTDGAHAVLTDALDHPDTVVRRTAALTLSGRGDQRAAPILVDMVVRGHRDVEAAEALGALARRRDLADAVVGLLADEVTDGRHGSKVRIRLVQALAELPAAAAAPALQSLAGDADADVARTAAYILERFGV